MVLHWIALVSLVAFVATLLLPRLRRFLGLAERVFPGTISVFYLLMAIALLA